MNQKRKILFVTYYGLHLPGGVQSLIKSTIKGCADKEFAVLCISEEEEFKEEKVNGIKTFYSPFLKKGNEASKEDFKEQLEKIEEAFKPDIVHGHNLSYSFDFERSETLREFFEGKCPVVEHAHHACARNEEVIKKAINLGWDKVITVSRFAYERVAPLMEEKERACVLRNCVDTNIFNPALKERGKRERGEMGTKDAHVFLFPSRPVRISTGKIGEQKQLRVVLRAASLLKERGFSDFFILIPGIGGYHRGKEKEAEEGLKEEVAEYGILENLKMLSGELDYEEMYKFYALGDTVLFPSLEESFGLVALEGMAMGLPVIGAFSGGVKEIIEDNETGLLISPGDHEKLALYMERLAKDKEFYEKIAKNGLEEAKKYDLQAYIKKLEKVWNGL